jgi:hypothetical protein
VGGSGEVRKTRIRVHAYHARCLSKPASSRICRAPYNTYRDASLPPDGAVRTNVDCEGGTKVHLSPAGAAGWIISREGGDVPSAHRHGKKYRENGRGSSPHFDRTPALHARIKRHTITQALVHTFSELPVSGKVARVS